MQDDVRRKLEMAVRVRDFSRTHPSSDVNAQGLLARLEERIGRAEALAGQQHAGRIASRAATARRKEVRRALQRELLPYLVRVGTAAAVENPEVAQRFALTRTNMSNQAFLVAARSMLTEAVGKADLLRRHGLAQTLIDDVSEAIVQYAKAVEEANAGRAAHVGARADLRSVMEEISRLVGLLDGLNRYRFRADPEAKAAWDSARNVVTRTRTRRALPPDDGQIAPAA